MKRIVLLSLVMLFFYSYLFSQFQLSGIVKNQANEFLTGANVFIEGSLNGTSTNTKGEFILKNLQKGTYNLKISFIGYETQNINVEISQTQTIDIVLENSEFLTSEIIVKATRAGEKAPMAYSTLKNQDIYKQNLGQDIPTLLKIQPSMVTTSDAGNGIGYSQFWIRGTDISRINITIDGIPMNDAESHGVWWVDLPDFASSVQDIQIQRGVGTSTNGAGAFGASINLQTTKIEKESYAEISNSYGSFNTMKNTVKAGSGLVNNHFVFDARLSQIKSDGYIDRAWSNLKSYYISGAYYDKKTVFKINLFTGWQETYQSWNGIPKARLESDSVKMQEYLNNWLYSQEEYYNMINSNPRTFNLYNYKNQIDHYQQNYYQMFFVHKFNNYLTFNSALHYTKGYGYYEEFKKTEAYEDYNLQPIIVVNDTITTTDLIRRKIMDNHFYGFTYSLNYTNKQINANIGGALNQYIGNHFGDIIWQQFAGNSNINNEWYRNKGIKNDFNIYTKINYQLNDYLNIFGDIQYRKISHNIKGVDDDLRNITQNHDFNFFNPKFGFYFNLSNNQNAYISYSIGNREPKRSDFVDATDDKKTLQETLFDYETGYSISFSKLRIDANLYLMNYKNQLVMTGEINDVGSPIMVNVPKSYRTGIEISTVFKISNLIDWNTNLTLSKNKIKNFTEYIDNWDYWYSPETELLQFTNNFEETNISFSPSIIASNNFTLNITKNISIDLTTKYVGKQYIDNTANLERSLDAYLVNDARLNLNFKTKYFDQININFQINNFLNEKYETNAWVYRYYTGGNYYTMDGYFPQAGINFLGGLTLRF